MARFAVALSLTLFVASGALAQTGGTLPFSTQAGGGIDSIDLATSNVYIQIPVRSKPGAVPAQFSLVLNSNAYVSNGTWVVSGGLAGTPLKTGLKLTATVTTGQSCGQWNDDILYTAFVLIDTTGASHSLPGVTIDTRGCYPPPANPVLAGDHSGYSVQLGILGGTAYDPSGNSIPVYRNVPIPSTTLTDPDRNTLQYSFTPNTGAMSFTDTLLKTVVSGTIHSSSTPGSQSSAETYQYKDVNQANQPFTVTYTGWPQRTAFGCSGVNDINTGTTNVYFPTTISLPDGSAYQIGYETTPNYSSDVTGRIASITLPSGGSISYTYADGAGHHGMNCASQVVPTLTRTVYDNNGHSSPWTYASTRSGGSPDDYTVTVTDPASNQAVYSFSGELQTQVASYQGSATGTPLRITLTCYNGHLTSCAAPNPTVVYPITQRDVYTNFNSSSPTTGNLVETQYDSYGNMTALKKYDWGPTLVSQTYISYGQSWNGTSCSAYTSANIYNTPCYIHTENASGTDLAKTQITYSGTGHPTSTARWVSGTTNPWLTSYASYNTNGTVATTTDPDGGVTNYSYANGCNDLLITSVSYPVNNLTQSQTWDCNGGVVTAHTGVNGSPASWTHDDPFWRPDSFKDQSEWTTNYSYTPNSVESTLSFSSSTVDVLNKFDGLGIVLMTQRRHEPESSNFDSGETDYDAVGRPNRQTMPYVGTTGQTNSSAPATTASYDPLGRVYPQTKDGGGGTITYTYNQNDVLQLLASPSVQKQFEYDGLGRLTSVCEITQGTTSWPGGTCGQTNPQTGYWAKYTYDALGRLTGITQNAQNSTHQTRTYVYDGVGRLTSESNPESGTTQYFYDTAPTTPGVACPAVTYNGDLVKKYDANTNTVCYAYDKLHRVTQITYPHGPNASATPTKNFVYDAATVSGHTMSNAGGWLAEAYTGSSSSKVTDRAYSYSPRGEVTDIYSSSTNSGGYYHLTKTYWANGVLSQLGGIPGVPTMSYGVDPEGRPSTVSASTGQNPVTAVTYVTSGTSEPIGALTGVTFGSTDSDAYQYDTNTGRMTQYTFNVNGESVIGKPTWNSNGTLQKLQITQDPFNSSNVQTCNYAYDDLARVASVTCNNGTTWGQTFAYDPFGNISKSVPAGSTGI
jgi:hypothetical protein